MYLIKYINDHREYDEECRYLKNQQILLFLFLKKKQNKSVTCQYNTGDNDNNINTEVCTLVQ